MQYKVTQMPRSKKQLLSWITMRMVIVSVLIMIFNDLTRLPIYRQIKQDTSDNNHHPCGCCCSADAYHPFDYVGQDEETKES